MNFNFKQQFIQDFNLPINIYEEPYFDYLLDLYNPTYQTKDLYNFYLDTTKKYGSEIKFHSEYNILVDKVRNNLNFFNAFKQFNNLQIPRPKISMRITKLYEHKNVNKLYYSLDLKQANFYALKYINPDLVYNANDYKTFIQNFTRDEYFVKSKHFRMLIFNRLSTQNIVAIELNILGELLRIILKYFPEKMVNVLLSDEILIKVSNYEEINKSTDFLEEINLKIKQMKILVMPSFFKLEKIDNYDFYIRKYSDNTIKFKNVPKQYLPQVYKHYFNLPFNDLDILKSQKQNVKLLKFY